MAITNSTEQEGITKEVCDIKMCSIKDVLVKHDATLDSYGNRIQALEAYNIEARISNEALQKQQFELKSLTLELDRLTNLRLDKAFNDVLISQEKIEKNNTIEFEKNRVQQQLNEDKNDKKFDKVLDSQTTIINSVLLNRNEAKKGKVEITKSRLAIFSTSLAGVISIIMFILEKIFM